MPSLRHIAGFTLIELMLTIGIASILTAIAVPAYTQHVQRARVLPALDALSALATRMEQRFQDAGRYACPVASSNVGDFRISCTTSPDGQTFDARATGSRGVGGYTYAIDGQGVRSTLAHPRGLPGEPCWSIKGRACDT